MKIYLSAPMSGIPDDNRPAIRAAAMALTAQGHQVISPAELDDDRGHAEETVAGSPKWVELVSEDIKIVVDPTIEAIVVLPGWEQSRGATLEVFVGGELGKKILRYPDLLPARHPGSENFHAILRSLGQLHDRKQQDYGRDDDPFANVRASSEWGIPGWVGALIRATDKVRRLQTYARRGSLANEGVLDAFDDLAVYAVIGRVLFEEGNGPG